MPRHDDHAARNADGSPRRAAPAPLLVAAGLVVLQGLFTILFGIAEVATTSRDRIVMGSTTSLFFILYGAGLLVGARALQLCRAWARGPVFMAQLIWLGLAWNFRDSELTVLAVIAAVLAVIVIAGLLHPASTDVLARDDP